MMLWILIPKAVEREVRGGFLWEGGAFGGRLVGWGGRKDELQAAAEGFERLVHQPGCWGLDVEVEEVWKVSIGFNAAMESGFDVLCL